CTPFGFVKLFGVVGQVLVKPHLLRDVDEEFQTFNLEEAFIRRKIENSYNCATDHSHGSLYDSAKFYTSSDSAKLYTSNLDDLYKRKSENGNSVDVSNLQERLRELESERKELGADNDKQRTSTAFQRNFVYPIAMLLLLFLTGITILIVVQNTLELLIGIKALPLSTRQFTLGITSLSKLGPIGAALEVCIIFYLAVTSTVGLYTITGMRYVRPRIKQTSLSLLIINCALLLILSSAQPLLSRIVGITNFDLLGDYGAIEWLGNFKFVLGYNLCFGAATTLCLVNKFTATVRRELCARLGSLFGYKPPPQSNQHFTDTGCVAEPADCLSTNIETKKSE
ncbi:Protein Lilipod, partial [Pseudolycoriella hygida]